MDTSVKLAAAAIGLFLAAASCNAQARAGEAAQMPKIEIYTYSQKTLLKNWALDSCMWQITKNKEDREDIQVTLGGFFEFGKQPPEAYDALSEFSKKYIKRNYSGTNGSIKSGFNTMKCMDMYHSKELDRLVIKLLKTSYKY